MDANPELLDLAIHIAYHATVGFSECREREPIHPSEVPVPEATGRTDGNDVEFTVQHEGVNYQITVERVADQIAEPSVEELAKAARPISEADWGSDRQIGAENALFARLEKEWPDVFGDDSEFAEFALKATTDEAIDEALRIVRERC